eukprot:scaffold7.g3555.t1
MALDVEQLATALASAGKPEERAQAAAKLRQLLAAPSVDGGRGKENAGSPAAKAVRAGALQALKATQQLLAGAGLGQQERDELVALGRASLAALDRLSTADSGGNVPAAQQQLPTLRYNFVRRLVAQKQYVAAMEEGCALHRQLCAVHGSGERLLPPMARTGGKAAATEAVSPEAVNLAVGAVLTMVLLLQPSEAAKHGDTIYRSLYKAAVALIQAHSWECAATVVRAMVAAAGADATAVQRAVEAAGKFAGHMPEEQAAALLAALVEGDVPPAAADDLLCLLCSAVQRMETPALLWRAALLAGSCGQPALCQAVLLLPALSAVGTPADSRTDGGSRSSAAQGLQQVLAALEAAEQSIAALEQHLQGAASLPARDVRQHLAVAAAAFQAANATRRLLAAEGAAKGGGNVAAAGGSAMRLAAASVMELLAGAVSVAGRAAEESGAGPQPFSGQGHAAAVGLVMAARLRALAPADASGCTCSPGGEGGGSGSAGGGCRRLLGWEFAEFCCYGAPPRGDGSSCPVQPQELAWLASALFNVGVDLHAAGRYAAAVLPFRDALSAAACCLALTVGGSECEVRRMDAWVFAAVGRSTARCLQQCTCLVSRHLLLQEAAHLQEFCKRATALSDAQQRAGDCAAALTTLAHSLALVARLGWGAPDAWRPLVSAHVRLRAEQLLWQGPVQEGEARASGAAAGKARGRSGAAPRSKAATGPAPEAAAISSALHTAGLASAVATSSSGSAALQAAELELQAWIAQASHPELGAVSRAEAARLAAALLEQQWPAAAAPLAHARLLLVLCQLRLSAGDASRVQLLERAVMLLEQAPSAEASAILGHARTLMALEAAQQLVQEALLQHKQQQRRESHAAASTSGGGGADRPTAPEPPPPAVDGEGWRRVWAQAEQSLQGQPVGKARATSTQAAAQAAEHLEQMLALQGRLGSSTLLLHCLLPGSDAAADATPEVLQHAADELAATAQRSAASALQRAALHRQAAERLATDGRVVAGLHEASEAHRLVSMAFHDGEAGAEPAASAPGWWALAGAYAASLMQLGQLFELGGLPEEAVHALKEGQRLVGGAEHLAASAGCCVLAAFFSAKLADIACNQGDAERAQQLAAAAAQELECAAQGAAPSLAGQFCAAELAVVQARVTAAAGDGKAALKGSQAAIACCSALLTVAGARAGCAAGPAAAVLHSRALLCAAECLAGDGDAVRARQQAHAALSTVDGALPCSATRYWQAAALLFLSELNAALAEPHPTSVAVWGLWTGSTDAAQTQQAAKPARGGRTVARGRSRAAAAEQREAEAAAAGDGVVEQALGLWQALALSRELPVLHRRAAAALAMACGRQGRLHLAALLLHLGQGSAMRLQYRLVLHTKTWQAAQRQRRGGEVAAAAAQMREHAEVAAVLEAGLDWEAVQQLGAGAAAFPAPEAAAPSGRGRRGATAGRGARAAVTAPPMQELLAALDSQAERALEHWMDALPADAAVCSMAVGAGGGSIVVCRLVPGGSLPLVVSLPAAPLSASLSQHPIRALSMGDEEETGGSSRRQGKGSQSSTDGGVWSALAEMEGILQGSARSMRELATDTREQQREWWRARLELDDRLAALLAHLDASWLGPWRCLLAGAAPAAAVPAAQRAAEAVRRRLLELASAGCGVERSVCERVLEAAAGALVQGAAEGLSAGELEQAVQQLGAALQLGALPAAEAQALAALLAAGSQLPQLEAGAAAASASSHVAEPEGVGAGKGRKAGGKSVKFADQAESEASSSAAVAAAVERAGGAGGRQSRGRSAAPATSAASAAPSTRRGGRRAAAAAAGPTREGGSGSEAASPGEPAAGAAPDEPPSTAVRGTDLCRVFDAMSLGEEGGGTRRAQEPPTTAKTATKHRSRLRLMQAATTPGRPATARKPPAAWAGAAPHAAAGAATAPRAPRPLPLSVAKTAPPAGARGARRVGAGAGSCAGSSAVAGGPVLLMLDGVLQALPWESCPGLRAGRLYRCPSLPCAAASARRCAGQAAAVADLRSTYYALNPSGDLAATQSAFQDWFARLRGWEGTAGQAPSAAELASALSSRSCFVYLGHGSGDQYIPPSRLRALDRCAAALLMGCSSGRLHGAGGGTAGAAAPRLHYDPAGPVLAYLLAGCPAAVANLWDVTDKDIDRFSQALLTRWLSSGGSEQRQEGTDDVSGGGQKPQDACAAVAEARGVCKLPHLIGAAPVCYGIPTAATAMAAAEGDGGASFYIERVQRALDIPPERCSADVRGFLEAHALNETAAAVLLSDEPPDSDAYVAAALQHQCASSAA